jgi:hypothetical protein
MTSNSKYIANSTLGLGPKKVNQVSLPILQRTLSRATPAPIQKANIIENNLAKHQLPSKKKRRSTSEPIEESKEIGGIDSQQSESFSASPLYRTLSVQAILPLYQPGSTPALYQPGSLASTSQGGIPFSKPSPDREVAPGSPGQKENPPKGNPGFVEIKDNPGLLERHASLMLKPILPANPSNIPISTPGNSSFRKPDTEHATLSEQTPFHESSSPAILQIKEPGKAPLSLPSSETIGKESMIAGQPQVENLRNLSPLASTQLKQVENGTVSFSQAASISTDRELPARHLNPVSQIFTDKENRGEKSQVESRPFILPEAAAKKESVLLPQSELLPKIPPAEMSKFEIAPKSGALPISQTERSQALPTQAQISDRPIQNILAAEKLDIRSAMDSGVQQIPIRATVDKQNAPASLHLPTPPAETQRPLAPLVPPMQHIEFSSLSQETPIAPAPLHLERQTDNAAPEPLRLASALPIQSSAPHSVSSYSSTQPESAAPVERNHEELSSPIEVEKVDVEQPLKKDEMLSEDRIIDVSKNIAEPTIVHTANLTIENLNPNGPSSWSEKFLVIENLNIEQPFVPPPPVSPEYTAWVNIPPVGEIKFN